MEPRESAPSMHAEDDEGAGRRPPMDAPWLYRGSDISRILALSDGIFAFAMTLLVLGLVIPGGYQGSAVGGYLFSPKFARPLYAYLITFFVIFLWWQGHNLVFAYIQRYDRNLIRLNTGFLVFIAIMPFATGVLTAAGNTPAGVAIFALLQVGAGVMLWGTWTYASGRGELVASDLPASWRRYVSIGGYSVPVVFAASIPVAYVNTNIAEILWLAIFVIPLLNRRRVAA